MSVHEANRHDTITYNLLLCALAKEKVNDVLFGFLASLVAELELGEVKVPSNGYIKTMLKSLEKPR